MLLIVGQVARAHLGREAFQEVDLVAMFRPLAKHVEQVETCGAGDAVIRAMHTAMSGRPGPVVLAVPEDVFRDKAESPTDRHRCRSTPRSRRRG